jgi:glycosyltransferase involved in cell wall biosynthesis
MDNDFTQLQSRNCSDLISKRIMFVTRTFEYGGAEKHVVELIRRLGGSQLQISILCLGKDLYSEHFALDSRITVITRNGEPGTLWGWVRLFRSFHPDIAVFIYGWNWCFHWSAPIGLRLAGIKKRFAIEQLLLPEDSNRSLFRRMLNPLLDHMNLRLSASMFQSIICVSNAMKKSLVAQYSFPANKMKTIRNGVSLLEFCPSPSESKSMREKLGIASDDFVLVCPARLSPQKGISVLLQALARCKQRGLRFRCMILGDGPLGDMLRQQSQELGLMDRVVFEGFKKDIRPYLHSADAFVLTSYSEGLPFAILEAMACGLPCIVTDVGGNTEAVTHEVHGLIVPPGSVDATADAISYIATHPIESAQMSRMARARACEAFDIEKIMSEVKSVILS